VVAFSVIPVTDIVEEPPPPTVVAVPILAAAITFNVTLELKAAAAESVNAMVIFIVPLAGAVTLTFTAASSAAVALASDSIVTDLRSEAMTTLVYAPVPVMDLIVPAVNVNVTVPEVAGISAAASAVVPYTYWN
jgi:hypothetical protein